MVFLNNNLSVLEVTLVVRRKLAYYYGEVYRRSRGKIEGSQTRVVITGSSLIKVHLTGSAKVSSKQYFVT